MMLKAIFFDNPAFCQYARLLAKLHELIAAGTDESPEGDRLREEMDVWGKDLTEDEVVTLHGLSEDLYSLHEPTVPPQPRTRQVQEELRSALDANRLGDYVAALALVRKNRLSLHPSELSYLRGSFLSTAGLVDLASKFFHHAVTQDPNNVNYQYVSLDNLKRFDVRRARMQADEILHSPESYDPLLALKAAEIRFESKRDVSPELAASLQRELIPILEGVIVAFESDGGAMIRQSLIPLAYALSAFCFSAVNDFKNAERCYEAALRLQPKDEAILTHRGIVLYSSDPTRAAADFEDAIDLRADFVWPYFFLAHYYVTVGRYGDCLSMAARALALPASTKVQSRCIEWRAICEAMLGYDPQIVVESFNQALQLEPDNRQIAKNRDIFQSRTTSQSGSFAWEKERGADVLELGRAFEGKLQLAAFANN